jgi:MFS family permease
MREAAAAARNRQAQGVLAVLVVVYMFNFLDRQLTSILAERIKRDLRLSDADLGLLHGTAFAVFYAVLGIPLGRLADVWDRRRLLALGVGLWSAMTALSSLTRSLPQLAAARVGLAVGEAGATPAAVAMLCGWFPARQRAAVLAIYSGGVHLGLGLSMLVGGQIVDRWSRAFEGGTAPLGLRGWQVAFLAAGLPGLLLALVVRALPEPSRSQSDEPRGAVHPRPLRELWRALASITPIASLFVLIRSGARKQVVAANLLAGVVIILAAGGLSLLLGTPLQWFSVGAGFYAFFSWAQVLGLRDPVCSRLLFGTPALRWAALHFSLLAFSGYGLGFWTAPYFVRVFGESESRIGTYFGLAWAVTGLVGSAAGGLLGDRWRRRHPAGRLFVGMLAAALSLPVGVWLFSTRDVRLAYLLNIPLWLCLSLWAGCGAATVQDLVLPRMRGIASAAYLLMLTLVGLAMAPYLIGRLSVALGDLRPAILLSLLANVLALGCGLMAARRFARDEQALRLAARDAGERED